MKKSLKSKKSRLKVKMGLKPFVKEHRSLIKVLKSGTKKQQIKEANEQRKELAKYI